MSERTYNSNQDEFIGKRVWKKKETRPVYTADLETDPFLPDRVPAPFACGLYMGNDVYHEWWGIDYFEAFKAFLLTIPPGLIYAHNGGKFDFHFWRKLFVSEPILIGARLVSVNIIGGHQLRDSFAIIPFPLSKYKKDDIEYWKMEADVRETHKEEIRKYLRADCVYLHEWVSKFWTMFGDNLTIASTAMKQLKKVHTFQTLDAFDDNMMRSMYSGGRVQCFESGVLKGDWKVYDVNSMYPSAMRNAMHPIGNEFEIGNKVTKDTCFLRVKGKNYGAFPYREKGTNGGFAGLDFTREEGIFHVSVHEWKAALDTNTFIPDTILETYDFRDQATFQDFVDKFFDLRKSAKAGGDGTASEFYKYVLNSAYGKFAQNPDRYFEYKIIPNGSIETLTNEWSPATEFLVEDVGYIIWKRKAPNDRRYNVSTAASITGAARATLLRAIVRSKRPVYCDTDSLVCEWLPGDLLNDKELGKWKLEETGDTMCIAGKKMYALFKNGESTQKFASKGVRLTPHELKRLAEGEVFETKNMAPTFSLWKAPMFITRTIRRTA